MATELRDFLALWYDEIDRWSQPGFFAQGRIRRNPAVVQSELATEGGERPATVDGLRSAMTVTLQHPEIGAPRANGVAILVGHNAGQLMHVSKIVHGPRCKKFRQRHDSQPWMFPSPPQIFRL